MILDALASFLPAGAPPVSLVAGAGQSIQLGNILDLLGSGVGTAPANIIGNATTFGTDMGIGGPRPEIEVAIGTALATATAATANFALQAAPDLGVGGNYQPGTWTTLGETGPIAVANLGAGAVAARFPFLPAFPAGLQPRYLRVICQVPAATAFTAGTVAAVPVTRVRDDYSAKYAASNFKVA